MRRTPTPTLSFGEVYGQPEARHETSGFVISTMKPVLHPEEVPLHTHPEGSFTFILSGIQISGARNASGMCEPGSLVYNPPGTTHRDRFTTPEGGHFLSISIPDRMSEPLALPEEPTRLEGHVTLGFARAIARECVCWDAGSPRVTEALCLELLAAAERFEDIPPSGTVPAWLTRAQELLSCQCTEPLSMAVVAREVGVHPAHLARSFSRFFKRSPGEHLRRCRVARAAVLLVETNLPLVEVALACGFSDQAHFTNVFKRYKGISPSSYRRGRAETQSVL